METNEEINSPERLKEFIISETKGYRVFALGSSAGGFAAITYGSLVNAERVYAFNSQFDLNYILMNSNPILNPLLYKYKDTVRSEYFRLDNFLNSSTEYFYFQSCKSKIDITQFEHLERKSIIRRIQFDTRNHGFPFLRQNLSYVLELSANDLKHMSQKITHPFYFTVQINGFFKSIFIIISAVLKRMKKKLFDEKRKNFKS